MSKEAWEWAEQFKPAERTERSWGSYLAHGIGASVIDAGFAFKDALTPTTPPKPLYIPDKDEPLYKLAEDTIAGLHLPDPERFGILFIQQCQERLKFATYPNVFINLIDMAEDIYLYSRPYVPNMLPPELTASIEGARWRDKIRETILFSQNYNFFEVLTTAHEVTCQFLASLRPIARVGWDRFKKLVQVDDEPAALTIDLNDLIQNLPEVVEGMIFPFYKAPHMQSGLYRPIRDILDSNVCLASSLPFTEENRYSAKLVLPSAYKGTDVVNTYLRDSPLMQVFA